MIINPEMLHITDIEKAALLDTIKSLIQVKQYGIEVISASIVDVHPDERLQQTIEDRVTALQKKQQTILLPE